PRRHIADTRASPPGSPICYTPIMAKVLIIGAGGVGGVVAHKCAQEREVFDQVVLASRTLSRCDAIAAQVKEVQGREIKTVQIDGDDVAATTRLLRDETPDAVINLALPCQDPHIMDACLAAGVDYPDPRHDAA